jgi:predicted nucleotidyltransferase
MKQSNNKNNLHFGIYEKSYRLIYQELKNEPKIKRAVLFGSRAMNTAKKGSDIDIAVYGNNIDIRLLNRISAKLNQELPIPYHIDILNYKNINSQELKDHIHKYGKIIYDTNNEQ